MIFEKICPKVYLDSRGSIFEIYTEAERHNLIPRHVYISHSKGGSVRGFHQQLNLPQRKIVTCISGHIADFGINIDPLSKDFGMLKKHSLKASESVLVGNTVAHGFECLSDHCTMLYICDQAYDPNGQIDIFPLAKDLIHIWTTTVPHLSSKDLQGMTLNKVKQILLNNLRD